MVIFKKINRFSGYFILFIFFFFFVKIIPFQIDLKRLRRSSVQNNSVVGNKPTFVIVLCDGEKENKREAIDPNPNRQIEQAVVLIKSAAVLTSLVIKFIIVVDKDSLFYDVMKEIQNWPIPVLEKLKFEKRKVCFAEEEIFKPLFRVCSAARLFLPQCITDVGSVVYLDTDIIFMKPPEKLWDKFELFDSSQISGMAPCLFHYQPKLRIPYYGETGLNAGVWMMNLTRIRHFPGGWKNAVFEAWRKYKKYISVGDQDIANIIFNKNSNYLHELECQWNYRSFLCDSGKNFCPAAEETGVYLVHGNAFQFYTNEHKKIKTMYKVWQNFKPGGSLEDLLNSLQLELKKVTGRETSSKCSKVKNIDRIFTRALHDHVYSMS